MHVLASCKNEEVPIKNESAKVVTTFLQFKSTGIFSDAQGQLTLQSMVESGRILNTSKTLWLSSLPAKMKKIQSKMKGVHNIIHQFFRHSRADNSGVGGGIWLKFDLIQAFKHVLFTCKNEDDTIKIEGA